MIINNYAPKQLMIGHDKVYSYNSHVATIIGDRLIVSYEYYNYSRTTSRHINIVRNDFHLEVVIAKEGTFVHRLIFNSGYKSPIKELNVFDNLKEKINEYANE